MITVLIVHFFGNEMYNWMLALTVVQDFALAGLLWRAK